MKTLHLNLTRKWFDMILSGEKKHEYREITDYWIKRLSIPEGKYYRCRQDFNTVTFSNGNSKHRVEFVVKLDRISTGTGVHRWGAMRNRRYFILHLGAVITKF